jgi:hypothetical protein
MSKLADRLANQLQATAAGEAPKASSLREFLLNHAQVKLQGGEYGPYSFEGREVLSHIVDRFDHILGSFTGEPLPDSTFDICGGAQWGKTIFALNAGVYLTSCKFLNWGYYLPDDDLVQGIVDTKLRPDVIEQIEGLQGMMELGTTVSAKGKKMVNRKGAFMMTDGKRKAFGMIRGMGKIPTSFSMDVAMEDEKDDIPAQRSKYLSGRMTASDLRFQCSIGTQRRHGAGQHKQFMAGTQEVQMFEVPGEGRMINIEENWPQICRLAVDGVPKISDPKLTHAGNFKDEDGEVWDYDPASTFYVADPETGKPLDRSQPTFVERRPERAKLRKWSIRVSQVAVAAISLSQPVSRWQAAVADPELMEVFYCDVLALPRNSSQALTPEIIARARTIEQPFDLRMSLRPGCTSFAGVDTGNRCWFYGREVESEFVKRALWAEQIPLGDLVRRVEVLFHKLNLGALFLDAHPAVDQARSLCYKLNGLEGIKWPIPKGKPEAERIEFPGGLTWDGPNNRWENLRCAAVQFTMKAGGGIVQKIGSDPQAGFTKFYPIIQCSRFDLINRAVNEFLGPEEQVTRVTQDKVLIEEPVMRLPQKVAGSPAIVETLEAHLVTGSEKDDKGDFVDECENHLLLANGYSALAELVAGHVVVKATVEFESIGESEDRGRRYAG